MRKRRPPDAAVGDDWLIQYQIVVPTKFRSLILNLAHDIPMAGHRGVRKTHLKVMEHFYWPGLKQSVKKYCRTCHTCHVVGKPNQNLQKRLSNLFQRSIRLLVNLDIDCVGQVASQYIG